MQFDDNSVLVATPVSGDAAALAEAGVTRFRYTISGLSGFNPGQVVITFDPNGWKDMAGNNPVAATFTFGVNGPTAAVVSPGNGANVDIGQLNNRNYVDV